MQHSVSAKVPSKAHSERWPWPPLAAVTVALTMFVATSLFAAPLSVRVSRSPAMISAPGALDCSRPEQRLFTTIRPRFKAFVDTEIMAEMLADPDQAFRLMELMLDPGSIPVFVACGLEPAIWAAWSTEISDPEKIARAAGRLTDPETLRLWLNAAADPSVRATLKRLSPPRLAARWMPAWLSPDLRNALLPLADPRFYFARMWRAMQLITHQRSPVDE